MAPSTGNMLPNTPGPKLKEFKNGKHRKIQFLNGLGSGAHSHVWKVKIDNRIYALKMFRHVRAEEENAASEAKLKKFNIDLQLFNDQLTPFNCEARAYGRLQEMGLEDIAWKCHGWVALDEETYSSNVWDTIGLPRKEWFSQYINSDAQVADKPVFPIYALVKQFIRDPHKLPTIDVSKAHEIAVGINELHDVGITHRDIQERNFVDSKIMDFSTSWTVPNIRLDRQLLWDPWQTIEVADTDDYFMFDRMIEKWNDDNPDMPPCTYRMTDDDPYKEVKKVRMPGEKRNSDSSEGSTEQIEKTREERMLANRRLLRASRYGWRTGTRVSELKEDIDPSDEPASNGGDGDTSDVPLPTSILPRPGFRLPGSRTPRITMVWSWSATPPAAAPTSNGTAGPSPDGAPRGSLDAKKLEKIRSLAEEVISGCKAKVNRAEEIVKIVDEISVGLADGDDDGGRGKKRPRHH